MSLINNPIGIVILGAGQIGQAVLRLASDLLTDCNINPNRIQMWDAKPGTSVLRVIDLMECSPGELAFLLNEVGAKVVINCLPFNFNEKVAIGASVSGCSYIDFTEDDVMADKVQAIYAGFPDLYCAVKCGLAPGFINYVGHTLVNKIHNCADLMISVGALPRNVNYANAMHSYNLSWSVDGLVNEYIRPCRIRHLGREMEISALTGLEKVIADGVEYEAAYTSGGVGSLVKELKRVPNVGYKTLRYPGHYKYVRECVKRHHGDFEPIKAEFLEVFPFNKDDVIVIYAEAKGYDENKRFVRETYSRHLIGTNGLTSIQSTTAGSGVAILELMITNQLTKKIINHGDIDMLKFCSTRTFERSYKVRT